jgi:hypothetical protein
MAKIAAIGSTLVRYKPCKRTKTQPTRPKNLRRKPYRGQGKP